jgi:hypothetical protein
VACFCQLTRDISKHMHNSNFHINEMIDVTPFAGMNILYMHIWGFATKPV